VLELAGGDANRSATATFARTVKRLRWHSRTLTRKVHRVAETLLAYDAIVLPDICADAREFVATAGRAWPVGTLRLKQQREAAENLYSRSGPSVLKQMKPYERREDRRLVPQPLSRRETERSQAAQLAVADELLGALGLPTTPEPARG
jgi:hypothetical protein